MADEQKPVVTIETAGGAATFRVEIADTPAQRSKGLMFRRSLADDEGMLFDFGSPQDISMWMKNTYIALDMIFVGADGVIHTIAERTEPFSEAVISSGGPARYVLEVKGGTVRRLAIARGDRMSIPER